MHKISGNKQHWENVNCSMNKPAVLALDSYNFAYNDIYIYNKLFTGAIVPLCSTYNYYWLYLWG